MDLVYAALRGDDPRSYNATLAAAVAEERELLWRGLDVSAKSVVELSRQVS